MTSERREFRNGAGGGRIWRGAERWSGKGRRLPRSEGSASAVRAAASVQVCAAAPTCGGRLLSGLRRTVVIKEGISGWLGESEGKALVQRAEVPLVFPFCRLSAPEGTRPAFRPPGRRNEAAAIHLRRRTPEHRAGPATARRVRSRRAFAKRMRIGSSPPASLQAAGPEGRRKPGFTPGVKRLSTVQARDRTACLEPTGAGSAQSLFCCTRLRWPNLSRLRRAVVI